MKPLASLLLLYSLAAAEPVRSISRIEYRPAGHAVCWTVEIGEFVYGRFTVESTEDMCINFRDSSMTVAGQTRWFLTEETRDLRPLFLNLAAYAGASTLWFEKGEGFATREERDAVERGEKPPKPKARAIRAKR